MPDYSKLDHWSLKAQKENYPARSVYKLIEMNQKFKLVNVNRKQRKILDLGAAPGSWSLYILREFNRAPETDKPMTLSLVSVDLSPLSRQFDQGLFDRPAFRFIEGDFTRLEIKKDILSHGPYDIIMSDAAPATSGNRTIDTARSLDLAESVLEYAETSLAMGGNLVMKIFQGGDTGKLLLRIKELFETGKSYKPAACRAGSFETYFLGLKKKG